jgi:hypothetical protein
VIEKDFDVPFIADLALREKQIQQNYGPIISYYSDAKSSRPAMKSESAWPRRGTRSHEKGKSCRLIGMQFSMAWDLRLSELSAVKTDRN